MTEYKSLKFVSNKSYTITLVYDKCKTGQSEYGEYFMYGVKYQDEDYSFFATPNLHQQLSQFGAGSVLDILKVDDGEKQHFEVSIQGGSTPTVQQPTPQQPTNWDDRDKKIQRGMCFNNACQLTIAKKKLNFTEEGWFVDLNLLVNKLVRVAEDKYNPEAPTKAEVDSEYEQAKDDSLPF